MRGIIKKSLSMLLAAVMISSLASCGSSQNGAKSETDTDIKTEETATAASMETAGGDYETYKSDRGWSVRYIPEIIDIEEEKSKC